MAEGEPLSSVDGPAGNDRSGVSSQGGTAESSESARTQEEWLALLAERDQYLEMARRARADLDNAQKRMSRDLQTERKYAAQPFLADLLPVIDNLDRAMESASADPGAIVVGVSIVRKQISDVLARHGVELIAPDRDLFDPNIHEAVMQQSVPGTAPNLVLKTLQTGYRLHDRVIRPAQVVVSGP